MNGSNGIVPTVDLATNNNNGFGYGYPVMPFMGGYGNSGFGFGGDGLWAIVLLAILFGGFNGNGFGGWGGNNLATTDFVSSEFTQRDISNLGTNVNNGFQNTNNLISNGFAETATNICNLRSEVLENRYANQLAECQTQRDILTQTNELNTNLLTQALQNQAHIDKCCCDLKELIRADGDETRALITQNTIQDLRDRLTAAKDVISDQRTENSIISALRPYPIPAYLTSSPYVGYGYGFGNGFYGNGFFGNTIV